MDRPAYLTFTLAEALGYCAQISVRSATSKLGKIGSGREEALSIRCSSNLVIAESPSPIVPIGQEHRHPLLVRPIVAAELFHHLLFFLSSQERVCNDDYGKGRQ